MMIFIPANLMRISIDRHNTVPIYLQIENHIRASILSGHLEPGTRLPATRKLAQDLGVNRNTVENAYAGLEADGLIAPRLGSGTYVLSHFPKPIDSPISFDGQWPAWQQKSLSLDGMRMKIQADDNENRDVIRFDNGVGDPAQFPVDEFRKVLNAVLRRDGITALDYGDRRGYAPLRETMAHVLASQGLSTHADHILVTTGSQQAISLVVQSLLVPGDTILVETPTYTGALDLFHSLQLNVRGIPIDADGMQINHVDELITKTNPKLIYTIPSFHNPTGICLSSQRRRQLIAVGERHNIPILEDDFVGDLRYEGRVQPTLKSLDRGGGVIYTSTFSKMLMPGLRVGFLVADGPIYERVLQIKTVHDIATSNFIQRALESFVTVGRYHSHLRRACRRYRNRRDALVTAIKEFLPAGVQFQVPQGGLFLWLRLPDHIFAEDLLPRAREAGVLYTPGNWFYLNKTEGKNFIRLNFVAQTTEQIRDGIQRLGIAIKQYKQNVTVK